MKPPIYRRIIYIIFIIIFFTIAPTVILYTQGYRYDFKRQRVQKTGILIISSNPRRAEIRLNNKTYEPDTTPTKIKNLLPGDYEISLVKKDYHNWQKKLPIYENSTTFAEDVILWKQSKPILIEKILPNSWLPSPNKTKMVAIVDKELFSFDFKDKIMIKIDIIDNENIEILSWSNTSKKIIAKTKTANKEKYFVYNLELGNSKKEINNKNYSTLKWDLENDNILYGLNRSGIWEIDLFTEETKLISQTKDIVDFIADNESIYFYQTSKIYQQKKSSEEPELLTEIRCENCQFSSKKDENLFLLDKENHKLFIVDMENKKEPISLNVKEVNWLNDQVALFYNDWEIWIYNTEKKEPELITRFGEKLQHVFWHPEGRHIIFVLNNKIKVIELDNRELRNVITFLEATEIKNISIENSGRNLYFTANYFDLEGFFQLNIR